MCHVGASLEAGANRRASPKRGYSRLRTTTLHRALTTSCRTLQGFLSGIGFLGGAVIFKSGFDVKGIKAAAAIWITGALGLAIATSYWWLGITVGLVTAAVMYVADSFPDEVREEKQETPNPDLGAKK